jgi:hypothetical protein
VQGETAFPPAGIDFFKNRSFILAVEEMVIFTRTFDFLTWLLPVTNHFPRAHRFTFTQPLLRAAFTLYEHLETANHASQAPFDYAKPSLRMLAPLEPNKKVSSQKTGENSEV